MAESAPQLPEDDIEAAPQQPVQDENPPADGDKRSHSDEVPELTYEQSLYDYVKFNRREPNQMDYLDFYNLSQMNILRLMNELAKYDQAIENDRAASQDMGHIGDLLHRYRVLPNRLTWSQEELRRRGLEYLKYKMPEEITPFVDTLARFIVAITGGLSLVVPLLVMRLGETLPKSLTTVSVAVLLFSTLTALMFKATNVEILATTATYAAVLVVFVGTSS